MLIELRRTFLISCSLLALAVSACAQETDPSADPAATTQPPVTAPAPDPAAPEPPLAIAPAPEAGAPAAAGEPPAPVLAEEPVDPASLPAVVARVNGRDITRDELVRQAEGVRAQMFQAGMPMMPPTASFYRQVAEQLIGGALLYQSAEQSGNAASDGEVTERLESIKSELGSPEDFARMLSARDLSEEIFKADLKQNLSIQRLIDAQVSPGIQPSEQEAEDFYQGNLDRMQRPEEVRVSHILVRVEPGATDEQRTAAKQEAEAVLARLQAGEDFAAVARETSDDPGSKETGGDLQWVPRGATVPQFEEAAFALEPGQTSGVVETRFGYHVIRVFDRHAATTMPFDEVRPRIEQMLKEEAVEAELEKRVEALRSKATIEVFL